MNTLEYLTFIVPFIILFHICVLVFVRPTRRVWLASLLGGVIVGLLNLVTDFFAYNAHWWHYTFKSAELQGTTPWYLTPLLNVLNGAATYLHVPLPYYLSAILLFGSLGYLFVWRFWLGRAHWLALVFLIGVPLFCIARDVLGGIQNTAAYQVWDNTGAATAATIIMWIVAFGAGFLVFWRLAPPREQVVEQENTANPILQQQTQTHAE